VAKLKALAKASNEKLKAKEPPRTAKLIDALPLSKKNKRKVQPPVKITPPPAGKRLPPPDKRVPKSPTTVTKVATPEFLAEEAREEAAAVERSEREAAINAVEARKIADEAALDEAKELVERSEAEAIGAKADAEEREQARRDGTNALAQGSSGSGLSKKAKKAMNAKAQKALFQQQSEQEAGVHNTPPKRRSTRQVKPLLFLPSEGVLQLSIQNMRLTL
jgi:hypothetical protein